ncbi:MAG TPA: 4-hydroxy-tetrahydrodipicolinate reductase [Selenomonadales bacterium]|nr:4-hydroxy-tetrahydrodipicolinate reductase [Selenomonadales bacterium]
MKIALIGLGTTGKIVAEYLLKEKVLAMVFCRKGSSQAGKDLGEILHRPNTGITVESTEDLEEKLLQVRPDVLIDFSSPQFLSENLGILAKCGVNVVSAVTGYSEMDMRRIKLVAENRRFGVVLAPNITYGVNVMMIMAQIAAQLHEDYDFQIIEENHKNKKDSPSGTAKKIAATILSTLDEMEEKAVPIHSIRAGDIAGRHRLLICGKHDQIEITHTAFSRVAFAEGAYKAAKFIVGRRGLYEMKDVFRIQKEQQEEEQWENSLCYKEEAGEVQSYGM